RDALKVLPADISADPEYRERFVREADLAAGLWHPNVVGLHDRGEYKSQLWISMDFVDGVDAGRFLVDRYPAGMPLDEVAGIVTAVAAALDYAHNRGLLHRDVKPANIMLAKPDDDGERRVLLADFGVARNIGEISGLTATNMTVGTVAYAAPEQLMGEDMDGRADQYALAATAFHLLTGSLLFPHSNPAVVISRHLAQPPPAPSTIHHRLVPFDALLARALTKNPAKRFPRCQDFAREFAAAVAQSGVGYAAARTQQASTPAAETAVAAHRHRPLALTVLAVAAVLGLLAVGAVLWRPWDQRDDASVPSPAPTASETTVPPTPTKPVPLTTSTPPPPVTSDPPPPSATPTTTAPQYPPAGALGDWCVTPNAIGTASDGTLYYCARLQGTDGHQWSLTPDDIPNPAASAPNQYILPGSPCMVPGSVVVTETATFLYCKPTVYGGWAWLP
ncbi:serine/threonine-protein kinase, partial [Mycolicibacterium sp. XJ2546]